jgi:hypothetical protein
MPKQSTNNTHQTTSRQQHNSWRGRPWWFKHYQAWQNSGLSKTDYCAQQDLNRSSFANWTARFKQEADEDSQVLTTPPVFFKATPYSKQPKAALVRSLTLRDVSITFEQPIEREAVSDWIEVLKGC